MSELIKRVKNCGIHDCSHKCYAINAELIEDVEKLSKLSTQRGARMQILLELLYGQRLLDGNADTEIATWFDDGVPVNT